MGVFRESEQPLGNPLSQDDVEVVSTGVGQDTEIIGFDSIDPDWAKDHADSISVTKEEVAPPVIVTPLPESVQKETADLLASLGKKSKPPLTIVPAPPVRTVKPDNKHATPRTAGTHRVESGARNTPDPAPNTAPVEIVRQNRSKLAVVLKPWNEDIQTMILFSQIYLDKATDLAFEYDKRIVVHSSGFREPVTNFLQLWAEGQNAKFLLFDDINKVLVGFATVCNIDPYHRRGQIRFVILPNMLGKGYTRLAMKTLVKYSFDNLLLDYIFINVVKERKAIGTTNAFLKLSRIVGQASDCIKLEGGKTRSILTFEVNRYWYSLKYKGDE